MIKVVKNDEKAKVFGFSTDKNIEHIARTKKENEMENIIKSQFALKAQSKLMCKYAITLTPGSARAQCYNIAHYKLDGEETIADRLLRDHCSRHDALRAAKLMAEAGCATESPCKRPYIFGVFTFLDDSTL